MDWSGAPRVERTTVSWWRASLSSAVATAVAMQLMFWARAAVQVRTLPERLMEWLLLFVPLDAFEAGIRTFGPEAKVFALYGAVGTMAAILFGIGVVAGRRQLGGAAIFGLAIGLFVVAMAGAMPLTGAGFFATGLFQHPVLVNGVYLGMALAYASVLLAGRALEPRSPVRAGPLAGQTAAPPRRALLAAVGGTAGAYLLAWRQASVAGGAGGAGGSGLPLARLPQGGPTTGTATSPAPPPDAHPGMATVTAGMTPGATGVPPSAFASDVPEALPAAGTAATEYLEGPPAESDGGPTDVPSAVAVAAASVAVATPPALPRDQNGALVASARAPGELTDLITATGAHYVVTKNAVADPLLDADGWRLVLDGEVQRPVQLDYATLRRLPPVELVKTLECISNFTSMCTLAFFGCDLLSTAAWKGARLRDVLDLAGGLKPGVVSLQVMGADEFSSAIPPRLALDPDALLVYEMNGQPLPRQHGFPVRLLVPGRYGMKNAKWVVGIRALRTDYVDWYGQRNWNRDGVVKTMSRIDVPAGGARLPAGRQRIAGIAYAGDRGIGGVQFSSDGERTWNPTVFLEAAPGRDSWVRWQAEFDVAPGQTLTLTSRAFDGQGQVQSSVFRLPQPDGGSGLHAIQVSGVSGV